ncbi:LOW QUALITY PROTEIN: glycogenin-1-like [Cervus elaphus]|uniref:LOW QUALITY PROTEIN: glycogenin-1-like n=1 Tax=Cervus elaphus TaxID=9860 RepID=UPI001CC29C6F|nr:LOW QUALITY PROTEIN: glycogenin-1-like [Cervus elaphus]
MTLSSLKTLRGPRLLAGRARSLRAESPSQELAAAAAARAPGCTMTDQAFVTLTTNDSYAKGALVLGLSLKQHRTSRRLVVLITPQVSDSMRKTLETVFDEVIVVDVLDSGDSAHLTLMKRPELGVTLIKLHCWTRTRYCKCVFMDADTLFLANIDDLFEREELAPAPDPGWPDCFNSGVFISLQSGVYQPSVETYSQLLRLASEQRSFDGGDQGLLNTFFSSWATTDIRKHLPFIYNLSSISIYSYLPAFKAFGAKAKVVHFLGRTKPWNYTYDPQTKSIQSESHDPNMTHPEFLSLWWNIFTTSVLPVLQHFGLVKDTRSYVQVENASGAVSQLSLGEIPAQAQPFVSSEERKERWEQGQADYMGADSFDNIKRKFDTYLQQKHCGFQWTHPLHRHLFLILST